MSSSDDDDIPLTLTRKSRSAGRVKVADYESSSDDGRPMSKRPVKKRESSDSSGAASSDSDSDDAPMVKRGGAKLKAKPKPKAKATSPSRTKTSQSSSKTAKKSSGSNTARKKTPQSRASPKVRGAKRVKKEEDEDAAMEEVFERGDARKHFKEGQTKICPPMGNGTRAFYESNLQENPNSLISIKWCIERGCLVGTQQKEVLAKYMMLKELGAYKLAPGGLKAEFMNGIPESKLKSMNKSTGVKKHRV